MPQILSIADVISCFDASFLIAAHKFFLNGRPASNFDIQTASCSPDAFSIKFLRNSEELANLSINFILTPSSSVWNNAFIIPGDKYLSAKSLIILL